MHIAAFLSKNFPVVLQNLVWFTLKGRHGGKEVTEAGIIFLDTTRTEPLKKATEVIFFYRDSAPSGDNIHIVSYTFIWDKHMKIQFIYNQIHY